MRPLGNNTTLCPHCGSICRTVRTDQVTELYREVVFACTHAPCSHIFVASITPLRTIMPSLQPNPEIKLPGPTARAAE